MGLRRARGGWLLAVVAGALLARAQLRGRGGAPLPDLTRADLPEPTREPIHPTPGRCRVRSTALSGSMQRRLTRHRHVRRASVTVTGDATDPRVSARLDVAAEADLGQLRRYVDDCLTGLTTMTGLRPVSVHVVIRTADAEARVH